jgi:hypothetical protein
LAVKDLGDERPRVHGLEDVIQQVDDDERDAAADSGSH